MTEAAKKSTRRSMLLLPASQRRRCSAALTRIVPITMYLQVAPEGMMPAAVPLHRAGWDGAAESSLLMAQKRARNFWELKLWSDPDWVFDPTGEYTPQKSDLDALVALLADERPSRFCEFPAPRTLGDNHGAPWPRS